MTPRIAWLASYPKSGNTWVRIFLSALLQDDADELDINKLSIGSMLCDRNRLDNVLCFETGTLAQDHAAHLRLIACRWINQNLEERLYSKIHDANLKLKNGELAIPADVTDKALYIIRNPLDVAVSYTHFSGMPLDKIIKRMGNEHATLAKNTLQKQDFQLEQVMGTWSQHVQSWTENSDFEVHVVRYEDLINTPQESFLKICRYFDLPHSAAEIKKAIEATSFKTLQSQEKASKFREAPQSAERFFRSGRAGDWKSALSEQQVSEILKSHLSTMQKVGYADKLGQPCLTQALAT